MTIIEKKSLRKRKAILSLVEKGEYSVGYALILVEELSDNGKLTDNDYEYLAEYLEELLNEAENPAEETTDEVELSNPVIEELEEGAENE